MTELRQIDGIFTHETGMSIVKKKEEKQSGCLRTACLKNIGQGESTRIGVNGEVQAQRGTEAFNEALSTFSP
jgi:hypothetical protein